jgi:hypothetical protein
MDLPLVTVDLVDAIERWTCMAKAVSVGNSPLTHSTPYHREMSSHNLPSISFLICV